MGARRLEPWLLREIAEALDSAEDGETAEVGPYFSPEERERLRQAILREGRSRGVRVCTQARGDRGRVQVRIDQPGRSLTW